MLSFHAGLALSASMLKPHQTNAVVDPSVSVRFWCSTNKRCHFKGYLGLLCLGKNDFEAIETSVGKASFSAPLV